ncbi:MAG: Serine esterase [Labilithrix sp.]|nr:Serine esterase [Labilithrix sp.]
MLSRRAFVSGLALGTLAPLAATLGVTGCARPTTPSGPRRTKYDGVDVIELFTGGASETSPLVVAIHGMGDKPDAWIDAWQSFPGKAQIALPRAFTKYGDGFSWFDLRDGQTDAELGAEVAAAEEKLWKGITRLAAGRKVIVTGFSQGGILSFVIAARHPDAVSEAFPVSGSCPGVLLPKNHARAAKVLALHGTADPVLAFKWGKGAVDAFAEQGNEATLREYPGVGHTITAQMRADLYAEIRKVLPPG